MPRSGGLSHPKSNANIAKQRLQRRRLVDLVVLLLLLYVMIPQLATFHNSLSAARHANGWWLLIGIVFMLATYLPAAFTYWLLAIKSLRYVRTVIIQMAGAFLDRLLPAGIGGMGVNFAYLRREQHDNTEAGAVVAANTVLGVIALFMLLGIAISINHTVISQLHLPHISGRLYGSIGLFILFVLAVLFSFKNVRKHVRQLIEHVWNALATYRHQPFRLIGALFSAMSLTILYTLCLWACVHATGLSITFPHALLVLALGGVGGTIAPTPGGLGGVEAGLVAGLVAYGASGSAALAAALLYRLVSYWLGLLTGAGVYGLIRKKGYV